MPSGAKSHKPATLCGNISYRDKTALPPETVAKKMHLLPPLLFEPCFEGFCPFLFIQGLIRCGSGTFAVMKQVKAEELEIVLDF
jgi:hypothetical protein